ncbi:MAG: EAL domain-containing protein [Pseudomonadota bacterium]
MYDTLTGLPDRALFVDRVQQELRQSRRHQRCFAALRLRLDDFRSIQAVFGTLSADALLSESVERLTAGVREADTVARLEGEEFAVLLPGVGGALEATCVAEKLCRRLSEAFELDGVQLATNVSLGLALFPQHGDCHPAILDAAGQAMTRAFRQGGGVQVYSGAATSEPGPSALADELTQSFTGNSNLSMTLEPQLCLRSGACLGAQLRVQWQHPEHGLISASQVHEMAERANLTDVLAVYEFDQVAQLLTTWNGYKPRLTLSATPGLLGQPQLIQLLSQRLAKRKVPLGQLCVAFDETSLMQAGGAVNPTLRAFRDFGISVAIDRFGAGLSALRLIRDYPVAELRIAPEFTRDLMTKLGSAAVVSSVLAMGESLNSRVVATGVADEAVVQGLLALGCTLGQGPELAQPMNVEDFDLWRRRQLHKPDPRPVATVAQVAQFGRVAQAAQPDRRPRSVQ